MSLVASEGLLGKEGETGVQIGMIDRGSEVGGGGCSCGIQCKLINTYKTPHRRPGHQDSLTRSSPQLPGSMHFCFLSDSPNPLVFVSHPSHRPCRTSPPLLS